MNNLATLKMKLDGLDKIYTEKKAVYNAISANRDSLLRSIEKNRYKVEVLRDTSDLFRNIILSHKQEIKDRIEKLVSHALKVVFKDDSYGFEIEYTEKRNQVEMEFYITQGGANGRKTNPLTSNGGGIVNIVSFVLRVVILLISNSSKILVLDERFAHVSRAYLGNISELLKELSNLCGIQFILVTHKDEFTDIADASFVLSKLSDGSAKVSLEEN